MTSSSKLEPERVTRTPTRGGVVCHCEGLDAVTAESSDSEAPRPGCSDRLETVDRVYHVVHHFDFAN